MSTHSDQNHGHGPYFGPNRRQLGRPRTRPQTRRVQVDINEQLLAEVDAAVLVGAVEVAAGASPYRVVIEMALQMWLDQQRPQLERAQRLQEQAGVGQQQLPHREHPDTQQILEQQRLASPPTPSDAPMGRR